MICNLCPRECGVDRRITRGRCGAPDRMMCALALPFLFEEPPISGTKGCGAVFFSHCNLACVFCQNHEISAGGRGKEVTRDEFYGILLRLVRRGVHTINLVSPTPYTNLIVEALSDIKADLTVPVVWNSNAYEKAETLATLEGLVDVFLPDLKYINEGAARRYSDAPDYPAEAGRAIREMHRQVGNLVLSDDGTARRGLMIRHLVLPGMVDESKDVLSWIADTLGPETSISLMSQYYPTHRAAEFPEIDRQVSQQEYAEVCDWALSLGFGNGWFQEEGAECAEFTPAFDLRGL